MTTCGWYMTPRWRGNGYVMGVAGTTASLANQAIFAPGNLALDLGTGCGVLAFLAAKRCKRVLATDKNPRAIAVARFNAALNGITNVDFAVGDLYEPVVHYLAGFATPTRFDFIYCNPPFVIAPSPSYMYRDSGLVGDAIVEAVARGAGPLLSEGGIAQFVCNWMHTADRDRGSRGRDATR
jgi:methylase of polypeptide subunit release factors